MFHFLVPCAINSGFSEVKKFASMDNFLFAAVILFLDNPDSFSVYCIFCFASKHNQVMANITGYFVYILKKKKQFDKLCTNRLKKKIFPRCTLSTRTACTTCR